jgi:hypothetical protein
LWWRLHQVSAYFTAQNTKSVSHTSAYILCLEARFSAVFIGTSGIIAEGNLKESKTTFFFLFPTLLFTVLWEVEMQLHQSGLIHAPAALPP